MGYLIPKPPFWKKSTPPKKKQHWCYLTHNWEDKGAPTFLRGIYPKVNLIERREFELAYYDYTTRTASSVNILVFLSKSLFFSFIHSRLLGL